MRRRLMTAVLAIVLLVLLFSVGRYWAAAQQGDSPWRVEPVWGEPVDLTSELPSYIQQTLTLADRVVATTYEGVWIIRSQGAGLQTGLSVGGELGESAILPRNLSLEEEPPRVGILLHSKNMVERFRVIDTANNLRNAERDTTFFHYQMAPDGSSYVGIQGEGGDLGFNREQAVYYLFDAREWLPTDTITVESTFPNLEMDSSYTPDGGAFLISSYDPELGLRAFSPFSPERQWQIKRPVRFFAPANSETARVLAIDNAERSIVRLYAGNDDPLWELDAAQFGAEGNVRDVAISPNGKYSAFTSNHILVIVSPEEPDESFVFDERPDLSINSLAINDKGIVVIGAQKLDVVGNESTTGMIFAFDSVGHLLLEEETVHDVSNAWIPTVQFDSSGSFFSVRTLEKMWFYQIEPAEQ